MDLKTLLNTKKSHLKPCKTIVTNTLGQRYEEVGEERKELSPGTPFVMDNKPDIRIAKVIPGLFLSSQDPVVNIEILQTHNIHSILSIGIDAPLKFDGIKYYYCDLLDLPEVDVTVSIEKCIKIIDENRIENILVHCNAGVSRSPTIVISYLMVYEGLSFDDAYYKVKQVRDCIKPNEGFIKQLRTLQMTCNG
ncbi:dual specificity protein phosphatase 19 [Megalopta genalis]|uniref:dual specificity protein phosphatase 19 n=1 Tax=Megalopta genalis TaxID=115081 RepID=UPI0014438C6E|nr:dual specificity protein phosphatase 19 [Megalopta genalis]